MPTIVDDKPDASSASRTNGRDLTKHVADRGVRLGQAAGRLGGQPSGDQHEGDARHCGAGRGDGNRSLRAGCRGQLGGVLGSAVLACHGRVEVQRVRHHGRSDEPDRQQGRRTVQRLRHETANERWLVDAGHNHPRDQQHHDQSEEREQHRADPFVPSDPQSQHHEPEDRHDAAQTIGMPNSR